MPPNQPFVQFEMSQQMRVESTYAFVIFTFVFLAVIGLMNLRSRPLGTNLVLWGIFVEILAVGYVMAGNPAVVMVTPALTKIGLLLVLGGVASSLLSAGPVPAASKEADHV